MREGAAGLVRDRTRKPGLPPLPPQLVERVVALTLGDPPGETRRRLQRGAFHSLVDLQAAINRYLAEHNHDPKPFVSTADPNRIIDKVYRG